MEKAFSQHFLSLLLLHIEHRAQIDFSPWSRDGVLEKVWKAHSPSHPSGMNILGMVSNGQEEALASDRKERKWCGHRAWLFRYVCLVLTHHEASWWWAPVSSVLRPLSEKISWQRLMGTSWKIFLGVWNRLLLWKSVKNPISSFKKVGIANKYLNLYVLCGTPFHPMKLVIWF